MVAAETVPRELTVVPVLSAATTQPTAAHAFASALATLVFSTATTVNACPYIGHVIAQDAKPANGVTAPKAVILVPVCTPATTQPTAAHAAASALAVHVCSMHEVALVVVDEEPKGHAQQRLPFR